MTSLRPSSLHDLLRGSWSILLKEIAAFGVIGVIAFALDIGLFTWLTHGAHLGALKSKAMSAFVSTTFAYFGNRHLSFSHRARTGLGREAGFFFLINLATLVGSLAILAVFAYPFGYKDDTFVINLVNLATIGIGTIFRFDAYKRFVFLHPDKAHARIDEAAVDSELAE